MFIFELIILILILVIWVFIIKKFFYKINFKDTFKEYKISIYKLKSLPKDITKSKILLNNIGATGIILILKTCLFFLPYFFIFLIIINFNYQPLFLIFVPMVPYLILFI